MSFGDPNNPYGPPQGQPPGYPPQGPPPQQPGYGYPTAPQGQPGYGYPQAPPVPQGYGYGVPQEMPGLVKTARVLLFIIAGFQFLAGVVVGILAGATQDASNTFGSGDDSSAATGLVIGVALLMLVLGSLSIFLGVKFKTGRGGIRVTTIVYSSLMILGSLANIVNGAGGSGTFGGVISLAFGGIILSAMISGGAWFSRPRY
ncbi:MULTISPECIES: hypothetical protein [unclassified Streptomyces]|uniref:hypothetical protein n=1 Tax=unclassified Streptomyces TaxID=2593676 RepID=UPI00070E79FF|nr:MULTISPECIES: hypothetical protein [unclassified Streptomyces]KRC95786.1 hypothetical protein ASE41_08605 [Streptomyces sp. Root264]